MSVRVVIAEDEWLLATTLRCQLEHWGCEVVRTVGTGTEALEACRVESPDLVFMDVQMPQLDGLSATRKIMANCPTCVVVLTGLHSVRREAEEAGAMLYLLKPLLAPQIPNVIEAACARFRRFQQVRAQTSSSEEAGATWQAVVRASNLLIARECISEEDAFVHLQSARKTTAAPSRPRPSVWPPSSRSSLLACQVFSVPLKETPVVVVVILLVRQVSAQAQAVYDLHYNAGDTQVVIGSK